MVARVFSPRLKTECRLVIDYMVYVHVKNEGSEDPLSDFNMSNE